MALIEIRGLTKLYRMGDSIVRALDGVDLTIERGEFIAITGASGSGKSTMMHLLGCLDRPTSGRYLLDGADVSELNDRQLAAIRNKQIGFVFQTFNLIDRTSALENVGIPLFYAQKSALREPAIAALERVGLGKRYSHKPSELSGGERQRVAIARAIVNNPLLLLADEPTGNLDSRTGEQIMGIFRDLSAQGVTIVLVTHEPDVALQARRIVQMRDGRIVTDRPTEQVARETPAHAITTSPVIPVAKAEPAPEAPVADAVPPRALEPRRAPGAAGAMTCSLIATLLLIVSLVAGGLVSRSGVDMRRVQPKDLPVNVLALLATSSLSFLGALIFALIGVFWSLAVRKRVRREPGNWIGLWRTRVGLIVGLLVIAFPVVSLVLNIVRMSARGGS